MTQFQRPTNTWVSSGVLVLVLGVHVLRYLAAAKFPSHYYEHVLGVVMIDFVVILARKATKRGLASSMTTSMYNCVCAVLVPRSAATVGVDVCTRVSRVVPS